jgi:transcriptional regulator with XRE-family HTH domain
MTQERLSEITRISTVHISQLENGHREPCLGTMAKLAKAFGLTISELMKGL